MDRPGRDHGEVLRVWHPRIGEMIALFCTASAITFGLMATVAADTTALVLAWTTSITCAGYAVGYFLITWYFRILLWRLRRLTAPPPGAPVWHPPARSGTDSAGEPPEICFRRPVVPDDPGVPYDGPPLTITYFRCFANAARTRAFLKGAWSEFGHVHLLRDPSSTTWTERWHARTPERMAELVVSTEDQLLDRLQHVPADCRVREFFCGDAFWQQAAHRLIVMADLVVIDLSALTPKSLGLQFELEQAFATKRSDQVVVLADDRSDLDYLAELVRRAWSPAAGGPAVVNAYVVDKVVSKLVTVPGPSHLGDAQWGWEVELHSDPAESRHLLRSILANRHS